jgi:hypothetical protein
MGTREKSANCLGPVFEGHIDELVFESAEKILKEVEFLTLDLVQNEIAFVAAAATDSFVLFAAARGFDLNARAADLIVASDFQPI